LKIVPVILSGVPGMSLWLLCRKEYLICF